MSHNTESRLLDCGRTGKSKEKKSFIFRFEQENPLFTFQMSKKEKFPGISSKVMSRQLGKLVSFDIK